MATKGMEYITKELENLIGKLSVPQSDTTPLNRIKSVSVNWARPVEEEFIVYPVVTIKFYKGDQKG